MSTTPCIISNVNKNTFPIVYEFAYIIFFDYKSKSIKQNTLITKVKLSNDYFFISINDKYVEFCQIQETDIRTVLGYKKIIHNFYKQFDFLKTQNKLSQRQYDIWSNECSEAISLLYFNESTKKNTESYFDELFSKLESIVFTEYPNFIFYIYQGNSLFDYNKITHDIYSRPITNKISIDEISIDEKEYHDYIVEYSKKYLKLDIRKSRYGYLIPPKLIENKLYQTTAQTLILYDNSPVKNQNAINIITSKIKSMAKEIKQNSIVFKTGNQNEFVYYTLTKRFVCKNVFKDFIIESCGLEEDEFLNLIKFLGLSMLGIEIVFVDTETEII